MADVLIPLNDVNYERDLDMVARPCHCERGCWEMDFLGGCLIYSRFYMPLLDHLHHFARKVTVANKASIIALNRRSILTLIFMTLLQDLARFNVSIICNVVANNSVYLLSYSVELFVVL